MYAHPFFNENQSKKMSRMFFGQLLTQTLMLHLVGTDFMLTILVYSENISGPNCGHISIILGPMLHRLLTIGKH